MNNDFHKEDYDEKEDNTDPIIGKVFFFLNIKLQKN